MASGVSSADFPNVFKVVQARNSLAANRRAEELQPSRVEAAGQVTELNAFNIRQNERTEATQQERQRILDDVRADKPGAFRELAIVAPEVMKTILEAQAKKRDMDLTAFNARLMAVGRFATAFAGSADKAVSPEQQQQQYTQGREALVRRFPELTEEDVPLKPNNLFVKRAISALSAVAELQKQAGFGQGSAFVDVGVEGEPGATQKRRVPKAGPTEDIGPPKLPAPKAAAGGGGSGTGIGEIKSADTNTLKAIINDRVGEFFDPRSGEIKVLDPERRALALAILDEASRIFVRGGVTHADAVTQAARKFDVQVTEQAGGSANQARPGSESDVRRLQLKAFKDFVDKK